jgi:hypothetical protein
MKTLHVDRYEYLLPQSMNEMTTVQLIRLSELVANEIPVQEIKVKMLFICLGARAKRMKDPGYYRIKIDKHVFAFTVEQIADISTAFDYLFTAPDDKGRCFLDNRLTVNHYPELRLKRRKFYAPKDAMTDLIYDQYIYLQTYDVMKERKPEALYAWLGCMFRRDKSKFSAEDLNIAHMKRIRPEVVILTIWFWIGSCRFISEKYDRIFSGEGTAGGNPYDGQQKLLDYIANADPEKKRMYKKDLLYNILFSLDYMLEKEESEK